MKHFVLNVKPHSTGLGWSVRRDGNGMESRMYFTREEAFSFAVESAYWNAKTMKGATAEVRMMDDSGEFQLQWVYEKDPYPLPAGK